MRNLLMVGAVAVLGVAMGAARADLPLIGPGGVDVPAFLPGPPADSLGRIIVTWNDGFNEVSSDNMPEVAPPPGSPVGTRAWARAGGLSTAAVVLKPVNNGTGWEVGGVLLVTDGPQWQIPPQSWSPGLQSYSAHLVGDATATALGRIDVGGGN
mgnify:CR=1 FL=1